MKVPGLESRLGVSAVPVAVTGLTGVRVLTVDDAHTCAIVEGGAAKCWGDNSKGELGDGTTTNHDTPVSVTGLSNLISISAGANYTCAETWDSTTVLCWGENFYGNLGTGTAGGMSTVPIPVSGL